MRLANASECSCSRVATVVNVAFRSGSVARSHQALRYS